MDELNKIEESFWHEMYDENVLMGSKDGVEAAMYIRDLKSIIAKLTSVVESSKPICPHCKGNMTPKNHSHYYSSCFYAVWVCDCVEFDSSIAESWYMGEY
jgi:tRNA(Ile2) C34 agmatinyltransferase TiaS